MNCEYNEKIVDYLENNLNEEEKVEFEAYLNSNKEFRNIVDDISYQTKLIKKLPRVKASSNFIVNLNEKIDAYESRNNNFWTKIFSNNKSKIDYIPLFGTLSLLVIVSFSLFKFANSSFPNFTIDNSKFENSIAINDSDSLRNEDNDSPILLIGNEK